MFLPLLFAEGRKILNGAFVFVWRRSGGKALDVVIHLDWLLGISGSDVESYRLGRLLPRTVEVKLRAVSVEMMATVGLQPSRNLFEDRANLPLALNHIL